MAAEMEEPAPEVATPQPEAIFHVEPAFARPSRAVSARAPESNSQARLQEIFMTEDHMSVERVLELCGGLPGIRSCILARGSNVLASHNVPSGIDLVSLTANAAAMLASIRSSSMRMGLGAIPAVTVHSEKGPVSFFHADDLVMLVLHADRGFVPGVRERLHDVVIALGTANLPVPLEGGSE
jgi:predicted regulator of Ras-like GTPase activity (Roadblock/LC7/MglB family)